MTSVSRRVINAQWRRANGRGREPRRTVAHRDRDGPRAAYHWHTVTSPISTAHAGDFLRVTRPGDKCGARTIATASGSRPASERHS